MNSLVLTIIGPDRPGLVGRLARVVAEQGGNWLDSRMAHLAGEFAGILHVEIAADRASQLVHALQLLEAEGLQIVVATGQRAELSDEPLFARLDLVGHDRPGIVAEIAAALASHDVNVEEWNTQCLSAPMSGGRLFQAHGRVRIPRTTDLAELREALETISQDLMVEVSLVVDDLQR